MQARPVRINRIQCNSVVDSTPIIEVNHLDPISKPTGVVVRHAHLTHATHLRTTNATHLAASHTPVRVLLVQARLRIRYRIRTWLGGMELSVLLFLKVSEQIGAQ